MFDDFESRFEVDVEDTAVEKMLERSGVAAKDVMVKRDQLPPQQYVHLSDLCFCV